MQILLFVNLSDETLPFLHCLLRPLKHHTGLVVGLNERPNNEFYNVLLRYYHIFKKP